MAQAEADDPTWEVNPAFVSQPPALFTWTSSAGTANEFPNGVGAESGHANEVGNLFYGNLAGVVPSVSQIDNYEADFFYDFRVQNQIAIAARVVNQSFIFDGELAHIDRDYDNYAAKYRTLFISGVGNSGGASSPATAYNGIGVGAFGGSSSMGPTIDGRSKPDLTAPAGFTSFSTPLVAGGAVILLQAGLREDAGPGTSSAASDPRTLKALLLNGSEKPPGWTNTSTAPLDARHGAGVLNVLNSYRQLYAGKHVAIVTTSNSVGDAHPPANNANNLPTRRGWDFASLSSSEIQDSVNHYFFDLNSASNRLFTLTGTLVWHRQLNQVQINDLDMILYNADDNTLIGASQSLMDNVEHLFVKNLPPARYNLQILKNGGFLPKRVTNDETYALAFDFGPPEPPVFLNPAIIGNEFQSLLVGEPNQTYVLQVTTNLVDWVPILTNRTSSQGFFNFTNALSGDSDMRFYRASAVP